MPRSALLLVNPQKPAAVTAAREVRELITKHGRLLGELAADNTPLPPAAQGAELIVVFGGDGTLLSQARRAHVPGSAMLGVNMGRLGFLAEFDMPALRAQAAAIFDNGPLLTQEFPLIAVDVYAARGKEPKVRGMALNEAVITAGPPYRMITLALSIDGQEGPTISGDGVIVSSPLGSTAYNLSAGGPILAPLVDALAITPIAAHSLSVRPVVVPGRSTIEIVMAKANVGPDGPVRHGTTLVLDGQVQTPLESGDRVRITRHERSVRFVQNPHSDYWSRLIGKLNWSVAPKLA
jgi:NAD+ kinase